MSEFTITVPDQDVPLFKQWVEERGFEYRASNEDDYEIPEWQKEEVRKSIRETKQGEGTPWEEVKARLFRTHK